MSDYALSKLLITNWSPFDFGRYLWRQLHGILLENQRCQLRIASLWNRTTSNSWIRVLIVSNSELLRFREILFSRLFSNRCLKHISSRISRWRLALSPHVRYTAGNCIAVKAVISGNWLLFHRWYGTFVLFTPKILVKLTSYSSWLLVTGQEGKHCLLLFHRGNWTTKWHHICTCRELTNAMRFSRKPAKNHSCFEIRKVTVSVNQLNHK